MLRLTPDGQLDASFGASGFVTAIGGTSVIGTRVMGSDAVAHVAP